MDLMKIHFSGTGFELVWREGKKSRNVNPDLLSEIVDLLELWDTP